MAPSGSRQGPAQRPRTLFVRQRRPRRRLAVAQSAAVQPTTRSAVDLGGWPDHQPARPLPHQRRRLRLSGAVSVHRPPTRHLEASGLLRRRLVRQVLNGFRQRRMDLLNRLQQRVRSAVVFHQRWRHQRRFLTL